MHNISPNAISNKRLEALMRVQSDYNAWFSNIIACAFYGVDSCHIEPPKSFEMWLKAAKMEGIIQKDRINLLRKSALQLQNTAKEFVESSKTNKNQPSKGVFAELNSDMEKLRRKLRLLTKISVLEDHGIDHMTGLYSKSAMMNAFKEEMDRLARRGHNIVVALVQIDCFEEISNISVNARKKSMQKVAQAVKDTLRIYDDAYRAGEGEFILCLKQADIHEGTSAMDRLHEAIKNSDTVFKTVDEREITLTITSCLVAPLPGDEFERLLKDLRHDLSKSIHEKGSVVTHHETSPLMKYVKESQEAVN